MAQLARIITSGLSQNVAAAKPATVAHNINAAKELGEPEYVLPGPSRCCVLSQRA